MDYVKPDALIITETHLDADVRSSEFMPPGYSPPLRKDRNRHGGGVLVAVKDCYTLAAVDLPTNPAEITWGEVSLRSGKKLILGSYYRSPSGNAETQQSDFEKSLRDLKSSTAGKRNTSTIIVGGDYNFKDIDWETETAPPGSTERAASQKIITSLRDHHLSQMQREPTREKSVLDLYITNTPGLVKSMATIPSFSDHDGVILVDSDVIPTYNKKKPGKIHVFSQAKWCKMKEDITSFATSFLQQYHSRTVNENWEAIKDEINKTVEAHVPSRISSKKQHQPWISRNLKRKSRKKHRLYRKAKKSGDPAQMTAFRTFKKALERDAKKARITYINEHLIGGLEDGNTKPLYRYIKQLRMENLCLPPLKAGGSLITSACDKAATLLAEFSSVFTIEDLSFIPWLGPAKHKIQDILVYEDGVRKLLLQLKPHKASGPDRIPNRRAFDTVPHERLMGKLAHYGIQGPTNQWIRASLTNRSMRVVVDGETSDPAPVLSGVPQGTILGPLLFLVYINDMPNVISEGTFIRLFADDCLVYRRIHSLQDQLTLQEDLNNLHCWATRWGMNFNPSKCHIMQIARAKPMMKLYEMCGVILASVDRAKYLGVTVSKNLQWHDQVGTVTKKANSTLHMVARNLRYCPRKSRTLAYCSLVRLKLEYCASVWDPHQQQDIESLEKVNRRATRVVYNKSWRDRKVSPTALLKELGWSPLEERRRTQRLCMMYKIVHGLVAVPPTHLVKPNRQLRGHRYKYQHISTNCEQSKHSFYPRTIREWNSLDANIAEAPSLESFRNRLSKP